MDFSDLTANRIAYRNSAAEVFHKDHIVDDVTYSVPWKRFYFNCRLNHGLARVPDCLPANLPVVFRFHRALSAFALIKTADTISAVDVDTKAASDLAFTYSEGVIPLIDPILEAYYAYSLDMESFMNKSRLYDYSIPYLDSQARRQILDTGLSEFTINLQTGKFPRYLLLALTTLDRLGGDEKLSLTKFVQHQMVSLDVLVDQSSILGYPLSGLDVAAVDFYQQFLKHTNR